VSDKTILVGRDCQAKSFSLFNVLSLMSAFAGCVCATAIDTEKSVNAKHNDRKIMPAPSVFIMNP